MGGCVSRYPGTQLFPVAHNAVKTGLKVIWRIIPRFGRIPFKLI